MGNRAVITTEDKTIGVYLHWNGGRDTVEPLLKYCELKGACPPERDSYGWAEFVQITRNTLSSVGVELYDRMDKNNGDNGVYIIKDWKIIGREFMNYPEQNVYPFNEVLHWVNESQPVDQRIDLSAYPTTEEEQPTN